jgi:hypothetical protein
VATGLFTLLAVVWTWPLSAGLATDVPWDLGDSLLNCWILAWHFHQAGRVLHGDVGAFADWWHPNIFHPARYGLGHSELLVAQALQGAPVYALTGNVLLTYNLLFLSSFVLSALGAFLLVRSLTRHGLAALVAGLLYGFALYRVNQGPHLQVLSSQWFPFVLWGLHEWWQRGRLRHALMAGAALALQNLSNGYFLVYAALWLPPYVLAQIALRCRLRDRTAWLGPAIAAVIGIAITAPFLHPYLQLRRLGQPPRPLAAVVQYSADSYAWLTANDQLRLWSTHLQTLVRPEGDLFPGLVPLVFVVVAVVLAGAERWRAYTDGRLGEPALPTDSALPKTRRAMRSGLAVIATTAAVAYIVAILLALFAGEQRLYLGPLTISMTDGGRLLIGLVSSLALLLVVSPRARTMLRDDPQHPVVLWVVLGALTVWLSFGPIVHIGGRTARSWPSLYAAVYDLVPGANALRVPPRIAMVTALALSVIGGLAVASLSRRRHGALASGVLAVAFVAESWPAPVPINLRIDPAPLRPLVEPVPPRPADHPLARALAALPADAVLVDLPFGSLPYELWWQYLSIGHWRARVNGYSGDMPPGFLALGQQLAPFPDKLRAGTATEDLQAQVYDALRARKTTHVVLHAGAWPSRETPDAVRAWLRAVGATPQASVGTTEIWQLTP